MKALLRFYRNCRKSGTSFIFLLIRAVYFRLTTGKKLLLHQRVSIKGVQHIETNDQINIGTDYVGFLDKQDRTVVNVQGKLIIDGRFSIGRGCRLDIGEKAVVKFGRNSYINPFTTLVIMHGLEIGEGCAISWNCQLMDEDFHEISYEGKKEKDPAIRIGNHVWVGANSFIYKGTVIPDGCIIAGNSVVRGVFTEKNALIGGNPARIIRQNVNWK